MTSDYALSPYAIPTAITVVLLLVFGARILVHRVSRVSGSFFVMTLFGAIWFFAFTLMYLATTAEGALWWARLAYLGVPFIAPAIYQFTVEMLKIERRSAALIVAWLGAGVFSALAVGSDLLVPRVQKYWWGFYPRYGAISVPYLIFFGSFLAASLFEFLRAYPNARGVERRRIELLIIGFGLACLGCVDYLPKYGLPVYPFGYVPIIGFVLVVVHTVRRYDLVPISPSIAANEIIGTMADALFVCDRDGRIHFANKAAQNLLGYAPEELMRKRIEDLLARKGEDDFGSTLRRRSIRNAEYVFRSKGGQTVELMLSIAPVMHQGEAAGAVIIGRDVRERKRADREVRHALTLLQSTLDSTADGILAVGDGNRILTYNQRFVEMWRIPPEILSSGDDRAAIQFVRDQLLRPDDFVRNIDQLYAQPEAESFDLLEFKDGRRFERYSIGRILEGVNIRVWSFRDVTARFATEAAMRESELRYRLLFEQNAAGVCVTKFNGEIVDCNSTFAAMLGARRTDLVGRNIADFYARRFERDELATMLQDASMLNGVEIELRRADGSELWVLQNLALVGTGETAFIHATLVDISDRKRAEEQIEFHAYHDVLTHLPNRRLFTDRLAQSLTRARRSGKMLAVMFIDLDHFKTINDTLGHTAGDELLLEMSQRLRKCVREDDTVARLGGDEFTIILAELQRPENAAQIAQKVLEAVQVPMTIAGVPIEVSASIGIAIYPDDGSEAETLLRNADSAMYRAKESGRNNYQLCTEDMKARAVERISTEKRLRRALHDHQLMLYYQPQVSLVSGRIIGAEALVRWNDPERGIVEPTAFIPIAEESRLIVPIGEWVLWTACTQMRSWRDQGVAPQRVAVNLSARQFQQHDLVDMVRRVLQDTRIQSSSLELEITETTAMSNGEVTVEVLRALRDIGVGISIDDFGTGYSSLTYLKQFPINAVKIDRAFVRDLATDEGDAAIVAAVIAIARSLHLRVIAEGVETEEQLEFLQRRSCDEAQGFLFSRPVDAAALTQALVLPPPYVRGDQPRFTM
ncbi:MAG TPA: EAL domain-containing protein [Thermoanaerobaculia bacterium]|nr:EAL domain-containing protein [Thermoanaerobaculia bacterium]